MTELQHTPYIKGSEHAVEDRGGKKLDSFCLSIKYKWPCCTFRDISVLCHCCGSQGSQMGKICGSFSLLLVYIAPSSTIKASQ